MDSLAKKHRTVSASNLISSETVKFFGVWIAVWFVSKIPLYFAERVLGYRLSLNFIDVFFAGTFIFAFVFSYQFYLRNNAGFKIFSRNNSIFSAGLSIAGFLIFTTFYFAFVKYTPDLFLVTISNGLDKALMILPSTLVSCFREELLFRGLLLGFLLTKLKPLAAISLVSVVFCSTHLIAVPMGNLSLSRFAALFMLSLFLGWQTYKSGHLTLAISSHILWNVLAQSLYLGSAN